MAKDPAFLFYSQDFIVGTMTMSFEDKGKYIQILSMMHQTGRINEKTIRLLVGSFSDELRLKFKVDENDLFYNERLDLEVEKRKTFVDSRRSNGMKGGRPKKEKPNGKPNHNLVEDESEIESEDILLNEFDKFWSLYDKKEGKKKAFIKWKQLTKVEKEKIFKTLPEFLDIKSDKQYRPHPITYLNGERWDDEIESNNKFPTKYDPIYEKKLEGNEIMRYHKHLIDLGWEKLYGSGGTTWQIKKRLQSIKPK